jgi:SOS-response transcriptional repressor LexA
MSFYSSGSRRPAPAYCARCSAAIANHRAPLTRRQAVIFAFIRTFLVERGYAPSFEEIAEHCGYRSLATVHEHLCGLERKGYITRSYNESRAITIVGEATASTALDEQTGRVTPAAPESTGAHGRPSSPTPIGERVRAREIL